MMRFAAFLWLGIVILASTYLSDRVYHGLNFSTDLMALLPQEEQNPALKHTNDVATQALSRRVVVLVGDKDRDVARAASAEMTQRLIASGLFDMTTNNFGKSQLQQMGAFYYPYRSGLLSDEDREALKLEQGGAQGIATRALSQVYGVVGFANAKLLHGQGDLKEPASN